jgi:hypothetical protein
MVQRVDSTDPGRSPCTTPAGNSTPASLLTCSATP